jgi:hypothetical protein
VKKLCAYFKISPQGFYKQQKVVEQDAGRDHCVVQLVQAVRAWHRQMGGKKLYHRLYDKIRALPGRLGRDKFFKLLARFNRWYVAADVMRAPLIRVTGSIFTPTWRTSLCQRRHTSCG